MRLTMKYVDLCCIMQESGFQGVPNQQKFEIKFDGIIFHHISCHWSLFRKPLVFWCFQGISKEISGMKWVNKYLTSRVIQPFPPFGFNEYRDTGSTDRGSSSIKKFFMIKSTWRFFFKFSCDDVGLYQTWMMKISCKSCEQLKPHQLFFAN